eukprot:scaffold16111_cov172-Amphora_coffeaeformis.AAC.4
MAESSILDLDWAQTWTPMARSLWNEPPEKNECERTSKFRCMYGILFDWWFPILHFAYYYKILYVV